jgi:hypothetical protein
VLVFTTLHAMDTLFESRINAYKSRSNLLPCAAISMPAVVFVAAAATKVVGI